MEYGTYNTIDYPTGKQAEAEEWLKAEFEKIGGRVRVIPNHHDLGTYLSFEVDYPEELEDIDSDEVYEDEDDQKLSNEKDIWLTKADIIIERYNKKFEEYL